MPLLRRRVGTAAFALPWVGAGHGGLWTASAGPRRCGGRKPRGYWQDRGRRVAELRAFAAARGDPTRMPTHQELVAAGRGDIAAAVRRHGGFEESARDAGLVLSSIAMPRSIYLSFCTALRPGTLLKPHNFWKEIENLRREIEDFVQAHPRDPRMKGHAACREMPALWELERARRYDLIRAIGKHGGPEEVARKLDLRQRYRSPKYWTDFDNLSKEIRHLLDVVGRREDMPPVSALKLLGAPGLKHAVLTTHGGRHAVAKRMGLRVERKARGYWCVLANREAEVEAFMQAFVAKGGKAGVMPPKRAMIAAGRADLAQALERHGGVKAAADALGLKYCTRQVPSRGSKSLCECLEFKKTRRDRKRVQGVVDTS